MKDRDPLWRRHRLVHWLWRRGIISDAGWYAWCERRQRRIDQIAKGNWIWSVQENRRVPLTPPRRTIADVVADLDASRRAVRRALGEAPLVYLEQPYCGMCQRIAVNRHGRGQDFVYCCAGEHDECRERERRSQRSGSKHSLGLAFDLPRTPDEKRPTKSDDHKVWLGQY